jgi:hypothetical protein
MNAKLISSPVALKYSIYLFVFACSFANPILAQEKVFNVMAPLHVQTYNNPNQLEKEDYKVFEQQLKEVAAIGVNAVSVDVWWGLVEGGIDNHFEWDYYYGLFDLIKKHGLKIVPILSFHQCGGNVNDNYSVLIPRWIWPTLAQKHQLHESDLAFVSEEGFDPSKFMAGENYSLAERETQKISKEYIAGWADEYVMPQYEEFIIAFTEAFADYSEDIWEINISLGPSGELRYPAYNAHDSGGYPNRGRFQSYSRLAIKDFQSAMKAKYGSINDLNQAWDSRYLNFNQVLPPTSGDDFFEKGTYVKPYGIDYTTWYNQSLTDHGNRILKLADSVFSSSSLKKAKLGFKMPGIHWQIANPEAPRSSEITSGLISSKEAMDYCAHDGYKSSLLDIIPDGQAERFAFHFTCLEKANNYSCNGKFLDMGEEGSYSTARDLVFGVADAVKATGMNLELYGENALQGFGGDPYSWERIETALDHAGYKGLTILRIDEVSKTDNHGKRKENLTGYKTLEELIDKYQNQ